MCCEYAQHLRPIEYLPKIFAVRPSLFCCNFKYLFITAYAYKTAMVWQSNCVLHICGEGGGGVGGGLSSGTAICDFSFVPPLLLLCFGLLCTVCRCRIYFVE